MRRNAVPKEIKEKISPSLVSKLSEVFKHRSLKNGNYSLRAYARDLKIEPSLLSKILRHKYTLTETMIRRLCTCLGLSDHEIERYLYAHSVRKVDNCCHLCRPIATEHLKSLSNTHCLDILRLAETTDFIYDMVWISKRLNLPVKAVEDSISQLLQMGYVKIEGNNLTVVHSRHSLPLAQVKDDLPQKIQAAYLKQALEALQSVPAHERNQSFLTLAIDREQMPKLAEEANLFLRKVAQLASAGNKYPNEVYHISLILHPVTKRAVD